MIRIVGFFVGAFLSASALVLLFGIPEFHRRDTGEAEQARMEAAIENLQRKWETQATPGDAPAAAGVDEPRGTGQPAPVVPHAQTAPPVAGGAVAETAVAAAPREWHAIWAPFRTEIAARGFVSRLERVTGLDYRVAKLRTGAWQVAFAYRDATERDAGLQQISAATGLDLSSDRP